MRACVCVLHRTTSRTHCCAHGLLIGTRRRSASPASPKCIPPAASVPRRSACCRTLFRSPTECPHSDSYSALIPIIRAVIPIIRAVIPITSTLIPIIRAVIPITSALIPIILPRPSVFSRSGDTRLKQMAFGMYALRFGSRPSNAAENARMRHFPYQPAASRWDLWQAWMRRASCGVASQPRSGQLRKMSYVPRHVPLRRCNVPHCGTHYSTLHFACCIWLQHVAARCNAHAMLEPGVQRLMDRVRELKDYTTICGSAPSEVPAHCRSDGSTLRRSAAPPALQCRQRRDGAERPDPSSTARSMRTRQRSPCSRHPPLHGECRAPLSHHTALANGQVLAIGALRNSRDLVARSRCRAPIPPRATNAAGKRRLLAQQRIRRRPTAAQSAARHSTRNAIACTRRGLHRAWHAARARSRSSPERIIP